MRREVPLLLVLASILVMPGVHAMSSSAWLDTAWLDRSWDFNQQQQF